MNSTFRAGMIAVAIAAIPVPSALAEPADKPIVVAEQKVALATGTGLEIRVVPRINRRPFIDASIVNTFVINRRRLPPETFAATTAQSINAWTSTVQYGSAGGYGTSVDQWVGVVYDLGHR